MRTARLQNEVLKWPPPDITGRGTQVKTFEQVSSDDHQMSLAGALGLGRGSGCTRSDVQVGGWD